MTGVTGFTVGDEVSVTLDGDDVTATAWTGTITTFTVTASDDAAVAVVNSSDDYGGTEFEAGVTEDFIEHVDEPDLDQTLYVDDTGESTVLYIGEGDVLDPNEAWTK